MAIGRRAYIAIRSHIPALVAGAALLVLCVACCVAASTAPAAPRARSTSSHSSAPARPGRGHRSGACARRASFHVIAGPRHRSRRRACNRTHSHHSSAPTFKGPCTNTTLRPSEWNLERVRMATLCLVDRERTRRGESALRPDSDLQHAAQGHSQDMAAGDYFEHDSQNGATPLSRMRSAGYIYSSHLGYEVGENIAWGTLWMASPREIVASWMSDPGHRANILDRTFRDTGIGVAPHPLASLARGQAGAIYTQDFGRIIKP